MNSFKWCYSVSDVRDLVNETIISARSLLKFVDNENIIIFYTPPRTLKNFKRLNKVGKVISKKNITEMIKVQKGLGRYGEKFHALFYPCEKMIFIDSDTLITREFEKTLQGDFEFSGRIAPNFFNLNQQTWAEMFKRREKPIIPMINTGYMIFKKHLHNRIADEVLKYMNGPMLKPDLASNQKDQYALTLAVADKKIKWMTAREHSFIFQNEFKGEVLHGSIPRIGSDIKLIYKRNRMRLTRLALRFS